MAPAPAASDVASHNGEAKTKKSPSRSKDAEVVDSDEDDESEKEDYEIEAILEAKKGQFKKVTSRFAPLALKMRGKLSHWSLPESSEFRVLRQVERIRRDAQQLGNGG
jgi:hypothetical protein